MDQTSHANVNGNKFPFLFFTVILITSYCFLARSCGQPLDPAHGWHAGECYTFGCRVTYHCGEGYELVGKQERFCQADGAWTPKELPTCVCK